MRGRKPCGVKLKQEDIPQLEALVRSGKTEQRVFRRARILLGMHQGERVQELSQHVEEDRSTIWRVCRRYERREIDAVYDAPRSGRPPEIPPLEQARVENLACTQPAEHGLNLTHWSVRTLQTVAIRLSIVPTIHYTTIADILRGATLQPHRWRYCLSCRTDRGRPPCGTPPPFARRPRCCGALARTGYERVTWLLERGILVVCVDEKPNLQVLERAGPIRPMIPGQIEQQEFEYIRHGTINLLVGLTVHNGQMRAECLEANDGAHFRPALLRYLDGFREYVGLYMIMDQGASHIAAETQTCLQGLKAPWVRVCPGQDRLYAATCFVAQPSRVAARCFRRTIHQAWQLGQPRCYD